MAGLSLKERIAAKKATIASENTRQQRAFKFQVGKTLIRLYPDKVADQDPWRDFGQHWIKDLSGKTLAAVGDHYNTYGNEDPIRNAIFEAAKANPAIKDHLFKECLARKRILITGSVMGKIGKNASGKATLTPVDGAAPDAPQLFDFSTTGFDEILSVLEIYAENDEDVFDLKTGLTIMVERKGTTATDTEYKFNAFPTKYEIPQAVFEKALDLDEHIKSTFAANEERAAKALSTLLGRPVGLSAAATATAAGALTDGRTGTTGSANDTGIATSFVDDTEDAPFSSAVIEDAEFADVPADEVVEPVKASAASTTVSVDVDDEDLEALLAGLES